MPGATRRALIVDHGLRAASAAEAERTRAVLAGLGMSARVLTLTGLRAGPGLAARARVARYVALTEACRAAGLVDLLLGHHAGDQAETVLMRSRRGSGAGGLAGMAALAESDSIRLVRPLLTVPPGRLRATLQAAGLDWVEDPTNADLRTTRARLRAELAGDLALLPVAARNGRAREAAERAAAAELAQRARLYPEGYVVITPGPISPAALALLLRTVSGGRLPAPQARWRPWRAPRGPATLAGVRVLPAAGWGRAGCWCGNLPPSRRRSHGSPARCGTADSAPWARRRRPRAMPLPGRSRWAHWARMRSVFGR
ncbi:MAG: tRNA lysidine(34) synthetase TilS [Acetobacteraceae bacterium]